MVLHDPRHPYTVGLVRSIPATRRAQGPRPPRHDPRLLADPRGSAAPGCVFADRCGLAEEICREEEPPLHELADGRVSRCHFHERR